MAGLAQVGSEVFNKQWPIQTSPYNVVVMQNRDAILRLYEIMASIEYLMEWR